MRLRAAGPEDAAACVTILRDWINETPWMPMLHSRDSMDAFWRGRLEECSAWVAEAQGEVCGFVVRDGAYITALYVASGIRGTGLGTRLLELAASSGEPETRLWVFEANESALRFYLRAGFRELSRTQGDNEEGLPDILLTRSGPDPGPPPQANDR
ncbi:MAG: GNAT family N-acetyltransferase [Pseudomonadota bacterium]